MATSTLIRYSNNGTTDTTFETKYLPVRLFDEQGNGIAGVFFWIDKNSAQVSNQISTEANDYVWIAVPDVYPTDYWINFWAQGFEPIVKTAQEVEAQPDIVLKKADKKDNRGSEWIATSVFGLILTGIIVDSTHKGKKVSGIQQGVQQMWTKSSTGQKVAVIVVGGVALYLILDHVFGHHATPEQKRFVDAAKNKLKDLAYDGVLPTMSDADYRAMANAIVSAVNECGTDEATIYNQFNRLQNEADFWSLVVAFGTSHYKGCFEGSYFSDVTRTLPEAITSDLDSYQVSKVNKILQSKQIPFSF